MPVADNIFDNVAIAIIRTLTYLINTYSGMLQLCVYSFMCITFCFALIKSYQSLRTLGHWDVKKISKATASYEIYSNIKTPLSVIAGSFFEKAKNHYVEEKKKDRTLQKTIPPDAFIRDAAFQFSERYFEEKFVEPVSMASNLMPPLGFIGTILGMVIHFLSNTGTLNSEVTIAGVATALYTTFVALVCYTFLEFLKKCFYSLARRRIDEGLTAVCEYRNKESSKNRIKKDET